MQIQQIIIAIAAGHVAATGNMYATNAPVAAYATPAPVAYEQVAAITNEVLPTPCPSTVKDMVAAVVTDMYATPAPTVADEVLSTYDTELPTPCPSKSEMVADMMADIPMQDEYEMELVTPSPSHMVYDDEMVAAVMGDETLPTPCPSTIVDDAVMPIDHKATMKDAYPVQDDVAEDMYADAVEYSTSTAGKVGLGMASILLPILMYAM